METQSPTTIQPKFNSPVTVENNLDAALERQLRRQNALLALGRRALSPPDVAVLVQDAAALVAEAINVPFYMTAVVSPDQSQLAMQIYSAVRGHTTGELVGEQTRSLDSADSLAGYALAMAHPVMVADLQGERRFRDPFLRNQNVGSGIASPLHLQGQAFGAIAALCPEARSFSTDDLQFVEMISHVVALTAGRERSERALRDQETYLNTLLDALNAVVLKLTPVGQIVEVNKACERVTGFEPEELRGSRLSSALFVPEQGSEHWQTLSQLLRDGQHVEFEGQILTKEAERRQIAWSCKLLGQPGSKDASILATGVDVTERFEAQQTISRLQEALTQRNAEGDQRAENQATPSSAPGRPQDRRTQPRRPYPYLQLVAPLVNGQLPRREDFQEVRCREIGAGGFSFLSPAKPQYTHLLAAFGVAPMLTYISAEIRHVSRVDIDNRTMYAVGCKYTSRVEI